MYPPGQDPLSTLRRFQEEVSRLLGDEQPPADEGDRSRVVTGAWTPAVDIKEEAERYLITADVPGVDPGDIEVTMDNGVLTIRGERRVEPRSESEVMRRVERVYGTFHRRFSMPDTADAAGVSASSRNGVLEVVIPKREAVRSRRIEVR